jgi:glycosyltransferase involved in cell wall biosynthesis
MPLFSIITCTKNSEKYLKETINSVKNQSFTDYEHIFIDGNSNDKTKEIILEYQKTNHSKIKFIQTEPKGIADAMNSGITHSSGEYLIHLHSDDYFYDSNVLEDTAKYLKENNVDWVYGKELRVDSSGKPIKIFLENKLFEFGSKYYLNKILLKYIDFIRHQSVFIRKSIFNKYGYFDNSFKIAMDYELWLRIRNKTTWRFHNRIINCFRVHDSGASSSPSEKSRMLIDEMRAGRIYMNWFEFYILRFIFKIMMRSIAEIINQINLYKLFINKM